MLLSVIIPAYNVESYLEECLSSIKSQTFDDFEVIIVDDGSTDSSLKICTRFSESDNRFRVFHKENGGQSSARNLGVKNAKGEYLAFIDSDDFFVDDKCFETMASNLKDRPDILAFRYYKYYSDINKNDCGIDMSGLEGLQKNELIQELVQRDSFFCSCWSKLVKRKLITDNAISFDESLSCEDMDWYFRVINSCQTIKAIDVAIVNYRQREGSVTSGRFKLKNLEDFITTIEKWNEIILDMSDENTREIQLSALAKLYCNLLISYARNKRSATPLKHRISRLKNLLSHDANPRVKKFRKMTSLFGFSLFIQILHFASKLKQ